MNVLIFPFCVQCSVCILCTVHCQCSQPKHTNLHVCTFMYTSLGTVGGVCMQYCTNSTYCIYCAYCIYVWKIFPGFDFILFCDLVASVRVFLTTRRCIFCSTAILFVFSLTSILSTYVHVYSRISLRQTPLRQISARHKPIFEHYLVSCRSVHI